MALCSVKICRILANIRSLKSTCTERGRQEQREILGEEEEEEAKSSRGTSDPASFVFSTIQFTPVHLHLRYFHSNSRGAIRSIFDIGTWLWKRSRHFSLNRRHEKKKKVGVKVGFFKQKFTLSGTFFFFAFTLFISRNQHISLHRKYHHCTGREYDPAA